jgi:membrane-bound inhibitor of C-type lysozyme
MKTFTSLLVNRLFTSVFTLTFIFFAGKANALTETSTTNNPGIEYASLVATATENGVFINWVTVSERNNSHFEVERSTDMKSFKTVAMVLDGFATTGKDGKTYKFKEAAGEVRKGKTVYYRLKQIDNNNQVHYSTVMAVQMNATVTIFPKQETSLSKVYTNNQTLLSKQSISGMGENKIPVAGSTAGILDAQEIFTGASFHTQKSRMA